MVKTLKIGHRGAKGLLAENTLASFEKALSLGVDGVELDVHRCASGELVVIHDETVDETTNGSGYITTFTLQMLQTLKIEKNHKIPTLREILDSINKRCFVNIELKGKNTAEATVEIIEEYILTKNWKYENFIVSSFDFNSLNEVRSLNTKILIGVIAEADIEQALAVAKYLEVYSIHPYFELLTIENCYQMKQKGYKVIPWTVNERSDIEKMKSFGVSGIITDFPDRL
jgi:glycerophosphoryl diester phosphodiesterase